MHLQAKILTIFCAKIMNIVSSCFKLYIVSQKKVCHFYSYDNFGKRRPIFTIFSLLNSESICRGSWN